MAGELLVKSPTLFAGYWNRPDATAAAFRDGWFATGDIAERSADGYYTLCGRKSDLIISGGFNIYPREIEEVLAEHPAVAEVAVAGMADRLKGEVPVAFVVTSPGAAGRRRGARRLLCRAPGLVQSAAGRAVSWRRSRETQWARSRRNGWYRISPVRTCPRTTR